MGYASKSLRAEQMIVSWPRNLPANFSFPQKDLNFFWFHLGQNFEVAVLLYFHLTATPAKLGSLGCTHN